MTAIERIIQELLAYNQQMEKSGLFTVNDLIAKMEPIYTAEARDMQGPRPRILISFGGGVGDFVLLSPCLREIRRIYEGAYIFLAVSDNVYDLALACPYIDETAPFGFIHSINPDTELFYIECVAFIQKYFTHPFDIAFNFASFFTGCLLSYMSGARERFLYLSSEDWTLFHTQIPYEAALALSTIHYPEKKISPHMVDRYLAVIDNLLHYPVHNREIDIWYTEEDLAHVQGLLPPASSDRLIAIGLGGTGNGRKSWPKENYAQLLQQILQHDDAVHLVITGGRDEQDAAAFIARHLPAGKLSNLAGAITYRQTAALLSLCQYYIGNDTGTMHLAAGNHIPVLVVFAYAAGLLPEESSIVERYAPYHVPSVIIQPDNALPECMQYAGHPLQKMIGCVASHPHCITQVTVDEMYKGYLALKDI